MKSDQMVIMDIEFTMNDRSEERTTELRDASTVRQTLHNLESTTLKKWTGVSFTELEQWKRIVCLYFILNIREYGHTFQK